MNLQALYDLKERLEYAAIAGTGLMAEDFRLRRAVEGMAPLAGASPVFAKITAASKALLAAPDSERSTRLLDVLGLVDAVVYTQGISSVPGTLDPITPGSGSYVHAAYSVLQPLVQALSGTGSGRTGVITECWKTHPEYFSDFRVLPHVVGALGDTYAELADLVSHILLRQGSGVIPLLKEGFDPAGKKEMARRVRLVAKLAGAAENDWYLRILPDSKRDVREAVIQALSLCQDNGPLLHDLCRSERGKMKETAMRSFAIIGDEAAIPHWQKAIAKHPYAITNLAGADSPLAADLTASVLRTCLETLLTNPMIPDAFHPLAYYTDTMRGKYSEETVRLWHWIAAHMDELHKIPMDRQAIHADLSAAELLQRLMIQNTMVRPGPEMHGLARSLAEENPDWFLCAAFLADLTELDPARLYDIYAPMIVRTGFLKPESPTDRSRRIQFLRALGSVTWNGEYRAYCTEFMVHDPLTGENELSFRPVPGLDCRWLTLLLDEKVKDDGGLYSFGPMDWYNRIDDARSWLLERLIDPGDLQICAQLGSWFYEYLKKTGTGKHAIPALIKCGWTDWKSVFIHYAFQEKQLHDITTVIRYFSEIPMSGEDRRAVLEHWNATLRGGRANTMHSWIQWQLSRLESE